MEIKKGDFIPTGWASYSKEGTEVIGFARNQGAAIEDQIICRIKNKKANMHEWAVGTSPKVSEDGRYIIWAKGEYYATKISDSGLPKGILLDKRECIAVPGKLHIVETLTAQPARLDAAAIANPETRNDEINKFVEALSRYVSLNNIDDLFAKMHQQAVKHSHEFIDYLMNEGVNIFDAVPEKIGTDIAELVNPRNRQKVVDAFVDSLVARGKSVDFIDDLFSEIKMTAIRRAEKLERENPQASKGDGRI